MSGLESPCAEMEREGGRVVTFVTFRAMQHGLEKASPRAYLPVMGIFRDASPRQAGHDLIAFFKGNRFNPLVLIIACVPAFVLVFAIYLDARNKSKPPPPEVIYIESWPASRTREESLKWVMERQKLIDEARAREKEAYKAFGRAVGMDVDEIEREAEADRAAAAKAKAEAEAEVEAKAAKAGETK